MLDPKSTAINLARSGKSPIIIDASDVTAMVLQDKHITLYFSSKKPETHELKNIQALTDCADLIVSTGTELFSLSDSWRLPHQETYFINPAADLNWFYPHKDVEFSLGSNVFGNIRGYVLNAQDSDIVQQIKKHHPNFIEVPGINRSIDPQKLKSLSIQATLKDDVMCMEVNGLSGYEEYFNLSQRRADQTVNQIAAAAAQLKEFKGTRLPFLVDPNQIARAGLSEEKPHDWKNPFISPTQSVYRLAMSFKGQSDCPFDLEAYFASDEDAQRAYNCLQQAGTQPYPEENYRSIQAAGSPTLSQ